MTREEQKVFDLLPPDCGLQDPTALRPRLLAALREAAVPPDDARTAALLADLLDFVGTAGVVAGAYAHHRDALCARLRDVLGVAPGDARDGPPPPPECVTRYRLTLVLLPDAGWPDDGARLRQALKALLRRYGIRCVLTEELG